MLEYYPMGGGTLDVDGPTALESLVGREVGPTPWHELSFEAVCAFAEVTGDDQWIHVDEKRARAEGPFGGPVAQGNLTLSLSECLADRLFEWRGFAHVLHRGWRHVSYLGPVVVPARVRVAATVTEVRELGGGWWELEQDLVVDCQESGPACEARSVSAMLDADYA